MWINRYVTLSFDSNGGSAVLDQVVETGTAAGEPGAPTRGDDEFLGWQHPAMPGYFDFSTPLWGSMTLVVAWLEHDFGDWEITYPTDSSDGSATRVCALCGKTETIPLPNIFTAYTVDGLTVRGIDEHTVAAAFRKTLASGDFGVVVTPSHETVVGIGTTVTVHYAPTLALTYTVVLRDDVNGDGERNLKDAVLSVATLRAAAGRPPFRLAGDYIKKCAAE